MSCSELPSPLHKKERASDAKKRVIVISGPTASGKTELSIRLAECINGEIISADSIQVYKGMNIGTAKANAESRKQVPHHLIDICDLSETFNVKQFYDKTVAAIYEISSRGRVPIIVGGTGFYLHSLLYGPPQGPPASYDIRKKIEEDLSKFGIEALYERLLKVDPAYGKTISYRDKNKVIRGLEIISLTEKRVSDFPKESQSRLLKEFDFRCWFVYFPKKMLYPRIEMRCDEIISKGFIEEVKKLKEEGLEKNPSASQSIGYRQCLDFLNSEQSDEEWEHFVREFKKASRRFGKRQFTWFRKEPLFQWIDLDQYGFEKTLELIMQDFEDCS